MDWVRIFLTRCAAIFRRKKLDAELDEELRAHIDLAIAENIERGLSAEEARTTALRDFGGITQTREAYRIQRGLPWLEQIVRDVRFAARQLRKSPGFTLTAILTLTLGLGANIAIFSLLNALLLRPLPVPHADQLAVLYINGASADGQPNYSFNAPLFRALEKHHDAFQSVAGFEVDRFQVRGSSGYMPVSGSLVSGQFFETLQGRPLLGRALTPADDQPHGGSTGFAAVITEGLWQSWFHRDPHVLGRTLIIAGAPFTVVGVMPKSFIGADPIHPAAIYVPLWAEPVVNAPYNNIANGYSSWWISVIARRNPGVSLEWANASLQATTRSLLDESQAPPRWIKEAQAHRFVLVAEPGSKGFTYLRMTFAKPLYVVSALCAAMLLLACLNLASLLMARAAARERELATRLAMGATRRRLVQQLLVEGLLIALIGTAAGALAAPVVSRALVSAFVAQSSGYMAAVVDTSLDTRVLLFVASAAIASTLLIGLVPALRATSRNLNEQIKSGVQTVFTRQHRRWLPRLLMSVQVALALILVIGAGLLATSLTRLYGKDLGLDAKSVADISLDLAQQHIKGDALLRWYRAYDEAVLHQPGVHAASLAFLTPLGNRAWSDAFSAAPNGAKYELYTNEISPDYFATLRIPFLAGRDFAWNDTAATGNKIVLNRTAVRIFFPGANAIGQTMYDGKTPYQVIGVVGDAVYASIHRAPPAQVYFPITQDSDLSPYIFAVIRYQGSPTALADAARHLAVKMLPEIPAPVMTTMSGDIDNWLGSERMMAMLAVFFAACALLVTAIGLYGTLAYTTARRTSEIGIRIALGAQRRQVVVMVFRENAWVALCGSLLGLAIALFAARALASFLYGVSARDPWVLISSVAVLALIASAASLIPAIRAARIEPITALRAE